MDDFKKDLQSLNVSEFKAGQVAPLQNQAPYDARLCVGIGGGFGGGCFGGGFGGGCFGGGFGRCFGGGFGQCFGRCFGHCFGGGFRCHHHCGGCGGRCF